MYKESSANLCEPCVCCLSVCELIGALLNWFRGHCSLGILSLLTLLLFLSPLSQVSLRSETHCLSLSHFICSLIKTYSGSYHKGLDCRNLNIKTLSLRKKCFVLQTTRTWAGNSNYKGNYLCIMTFIMSLVTYHLKQIL